MIHNYTYLQQLIRQAVAQLATQAELSANFELTIPTHQQFGDYTTNIALVSWKNVPDKAYQSAHQFANELVKLIQQLDHEQRIHDLQIAGPGFINIWIKLSSVITMANTYPDLIADSERQQKILVEFLSPNTNKQLHIGHVLNGVIGTAIINIMRAAGYQVDGGTHSNDRGIHIMKSMYGYLRCARIDSIRQTKQGLETTISQSIYYQELLSEWITSPSHWSSPQALDIKPDHFIGWCYTKGNEISEADTAVQSELSGMLRDWESNQPNIRMLWKQMNDWFYEGYYQTLRNLGIRVANDTRQTFDYMSFESEIYKNGKDIILSNIGNGLIEEFSDGHVEAVLEPIHHIPNIVLLRKDKTALYITQDIELLRTRIKDLKYDQVIYVVDYRQSLQFKQLFIIVESLGIPEAKKCLHLAYGEVRTPQGSMSSRKGNIISADWLIEETTARAKAKVNSEHHGYDSAEIEGIAKEVALAAIKFGMLKYNPSSNIVFDIDSNISFEGETGPYIQYTGARASSILAKNPETLQVIDLSKLVESDIHQEINILRKLEKYPLIIKNAATSKSPNLLCGYLYELCQMYNLFYAQKPILKEANQELKNIRLVITSKVNHTISNGLSLLGINALERM